MTNPNIKFFRCHPWPSTVTPQEGYIWFNTNDRTINLYKDGDWEKYTGNIEDLSPRVSTLETTVNTHSQAIAAVIGKFDGIGDNNVTTYVSNVINDLDAEVTSENGAFVNVTVTQADGVITGVSIAESNIASDSALSDEKTRAEGVEASLQSAINTEKGRIDVLIGSDSGSIRDIAIDVLTETLVSESANESFDTLQEVSAWIKAHPESAAGMNQKIITNETNIATNTADITELKAAWA